MIREIEFLASIDLVKIDRLGEGKLTLLVPEDNLPEMLKCSAFTERIVRVNLKLEE